MGLSGGIQSDSLPVDPRGAPLSPPRVQAPHVSDVPADGVMASSTGTLCVLPRAWLRTRTQEDREGPAWTRVPSAHGAEPGRLSRTWSALFQRSGLSPFLVSPRLPTLPPSRCAHALSREELFLFWKPMSNLPPGRWLFCPKEQRAQKPVLSGTPQVPPTNPLRFFTCYFISNEFCRLDFPDTAEQTPQLILGHVLREVVDN